MTSEFELPWPPSVNHYYRHVGPRVLISRDGRRYREKVVSLFKFEQEEKRTGNVELHIELYPPDKRRRDVDNCLKCLLDTLTHAGVYEDDSQIGKLTITKEEPMPPDGMVYVRISDMKQRRQNGGFRRKIVQDYVQSIEDDTKRLVCFLYMRNHTDAEICKVLRIDAQRLQQLKDQIAFDLRKAGIQQE